MVSPLPTLVTLAQAKKHLQLQPGQGDDADIYLKIEAATDIVLTHIYRDDDDWVDTMIAWTDATVPRSIQAAVLVQLAELHRFRGDDGAKDVPERGHGFLSPAVTAYLHKYRDPSIA